MILINVPTFVRKNFRGNFRYSPTQWNLSFPIFRNGSIVECNICWIITMYAFPPHIFPTTTVIDEVDYKM